MPNLDPWINQIEEHIVINTITNKFENHLLSIKAEHQKQIRPNLYHPTYNERHQKIIELLDWTLERYRTATASIGIKVIGELNHYNQIIILMSF
jgi:hypothetical protein